MGGQSEYLSRDNDVTIVLALNRISALNGISLEVLYATYTLGAFLLLCEVSQKSIKGKFEVSLNFYKKGINYA